MIVSNGNITRNISEKQLHEYALKGYKELKTPEKPKAPEKAKK